MIVTLVVYVAAALSAFGLAYWAYRARADRSAFVGLYLLFGVPGGLLALAGLAWLVSGDDLGILLLLLGLGLSLPLLAPIRRLVAAVTPMDPDSPVDMTGLCLLLAVMAILGYTIGVSPETPEDLESVGLVDIVLQAAVQVALAYAAVGWWFVRSFGEATARLGIVRPTWRTPLAAVGYLVVAVVLYAIVGAVAQQVQPEIFEDLDSVTEDITAEVRNPVGAVVLGASAGIGEEAIFRGALQPRFGIVLTSITFALLHAPQYGFTLIILGLFLISVVLGVERRRLGTTAAMVTHGLYDFLAVMAQTYL